MARRDGALPAPAAIDPIDVRDHVVWRCHEPGELLVERVALDQPQLAIGDLGRIAIADERRQAAV